MVNVFFALTDEFNSDGVIALLASGQAVVFYRIALMQGRDWVLKETGGACRHVRSVLARHGARYRPGARYEWAAQSYLAEFRATVPIEAPLEDAHAVAVRLAERSLPTTLEGAAS